MAALTMLSETAGCLSAWFLTLCCQIGCLGSTTRTRAHRAACSLTSVAEVFGRFAETTRLQHVPETIVSCTRFHLPSSSCSDYHHHRYHHALVHVVQRSKGAANTSALACPHKASTLLTVRAVSYARSVIHPVSVVYSCETLYWCGPCSHKA